MRPTQVGLGRALRNYIYVKDVAASILHVLETHLEGMQLLAGTEVLPINTMLKLVCDAFISGKTPMLYTGREAENQIVTSSGLLPKTRSFKEALLSIGDDYRNETCTAR
jgi:hypothetical protein